MTDRAIRRYRQLRIGLEMTATKARLLALLWAAISDEEHEAHRAEMDRRLDEHRRRTLAQGWSFMGVEDY
jgi:hypothetical protein